MSNNDDGFQSAEEDEDSLAEIENPEEIVADVDSQIPMPHLPHTPSEHDHGTEFGEDIDDDEFHEAANEV